MVETRRLDGFSAAGAICRGHARIDLHRPQPETLRRRRIPYERVTNMKTVLVYASNLLPWSETFIKEQIAALHRWHGVLIGMRRARQLSLDGVEVCVLRPDRPTLSDRLRWKLSGAFGTIPSSTVRQLSMSRPSLLHAHFGVEGVKAWPIAKALNIPMLVTLHGYDINIRSDWWEAGYGSVYGGPAMRHYPERLLKLASHPRVTFIAVSEAIRRRAIAFGIPPNKLAVHYIGVDTSKFTPGGRPIGDREPRILFVGRFTEKKGCEYLIRAVAKVRKDVPGVRLVLAGDGELRNRLQQLVLDLGVSAEFLGALTVTQVVEQLHLARALCLPSVTAANGDAEGFGLVLLEAQAAGVPVVTSALGGALEGIQEGVTGLSFRERDVDALATHLRIILNNDAIANTLSTAGPAFVSKYFSLANCTAALELIYDKITAD
jgi:glycosyltransferase involved in cell wall biosynthesis